MPLENFKIYINVTDESIKAPVQDMINKNFKLSENENDCDLYLSDDHHKKSSTAINLLMSNVTKIPEFKGLADIDGFNHYVIYNENDFLVDRVFHAIQRQCLLRSGTDNSDLTGVRALIRLEQSVHSSGINLPIIKSFDVSSSKERNKLAEEMEKFFKDIEPFIGNQSSTFAQFAVEIQEELLMNAIWDANPKHEKSSRTLPIDLNENEKVKLEWGFNGKDLAISVRDNFGRLNPKVMTKYVKFIFKTGTQESHQLGERQISAGLGMYMILQRANILSVFVSQGKLTDVGVVICIANKRRTKNNTPKALDIIHLEKK